MNEQFNELLKAYSWLPIHSNNPKMVSFKREESCERMNIYFTSGTVTIQDLNRKIKVYKNTQLMSSEELEKILI